MTSSHTIQHGTQKTVRKVQIRGDKGYKTVTKYEGGKKVHTVKRAISEKHIRKIQRGKFVKTLFHDCKQGKC